MSPLYLYWFQWGVLGGILPELYALYNLRHDFHTVRPAYLTSWFYWVMTLTMILVGGGMVLLYISNDVRLTPFLAVHIGAATPILIGTLFKGKPALPPGI